MLAGSRPCSGVCGCEPEQLVDGLRRLRLHGGKRSGGDTSPSKVPDGSGGSWSRPPLSGYEQVSATSPTNDTDGKTVTVTCPAGKKVLSGGWTSPEFFVFAGESLPAESFPSASDEWTVSAFANNAPGETWTLTVFAICATVT